MARLAAAIGSAAIGLAALLTALFTAAVLWMIAGAIVVALYVIRRRRNRARLARLRASEIPDRPAYWLGEETAPAEDDAADGGRTGPSGSA